MFDYAISHGTLTSKNHLFQYFVTNHGFTKSSMARKPRLRIPGGIYHVLLRGNDGQDVFLTNGDRSHFYGLVVEGLERYEHRVHAFCLVPNHVLN